MATRAFTDWKITSLRATSISAPSFFSVFTDSNTGTPSASKVCTPR